MPKLVTPTLPEFKPKKGPVCKGMYMFGQNPILERFGLARALDARRAGLGALRALKKKGLRGPELADALTQFARQAGFLRNDIEVAHLRNDWFGSWFPKRPVAEVFLEAFLQAATLALANKAGALPIEAYWAIAYDDQVSAAVTRSEHQVTVVLFTPAPAEQPRVRALAKKDPVWLIRGQRKITVSQNAMTGLAVDAKVARASATRGSAARRKAPKRDK